MKCLVAARHFGYLRNFESALVELARRGHTLHLTADRPEQVGGESMVRRIAAAYPGVTVGFTPPRRDRAWNDLSSDVRHAQDYLRYLAPAYAETPRLRERAEVRAPRALRRAVDPGPLHELRRAIVRRLLTLAEEATPVPGELVAFLEDVAPDVVVLTPLIDLGSPQLDLLKAARRLGLRTVLAVGSWDHLSSKALIRIPPDLVTVWNQTQRDEAVAMHGLSPELIAITGAQCYDQWFDRQPSRPREQFCGELGLPPDRPLLLYVCSSPFRGEPPEADFVVRWLTALRAAEPALAQAAVLIRPHPGRLHEWEGRSLSALGPVAIHGGNPIDDHSRRDYFDALFHSAAVAGLNTSAFIEAGIVGRPVHALLAPEFRASQQGTLHFRYLTEAGGGLLRLSRSFDEHLAQLAASVRGDHRDDRNQGFVGAFVRPFGLDRPATPMFVDAIEHLGQQPRPACWSPSWRARLMRPALATAARRRKPRQKPAAGLTPAPLKPRHER